MNEIKNQYFIARLIAPNVIENIISDNLKLGKEDYHAMKKANVELSENKPYALLIQPGYFNKPSEDFIDLTTKNDSKTPTKARAILVLSLGHRISGNFYLKFRNPKVNTRLFNNRDQAIAWLQKEIG